MASEARPRENPIVNPEHACELLRRIVDAFDRADVDNRREHKIASAMADARQLLGVTKRRPVKL